MLYRVLEIEGKSFTEEFLQWQRRRKQKRRNTNRLAKRYFAWAEYCNRLSGEALLRGVVVYGDCAAGLGRNQTLSVQEISRLRTGLCVTIMKTSGSSVAAGKCEEEVQTT